MTIRDTLKSIGLVGLLALSGIGCASRPIIGNTNYAVGTRNDDSAIVRIAERVKQTAEWIENRGDHIEYANARAFDSFPLRINATFDDYQPFGNFGSEDILNLRVYGAGVVPTPQGCDSFLQLGDIGLDGLADGREVQSVDQSGSQYATCFRVTQDSEGHVTGIREVRGLGQEAELLYREVIGIVNENLR